jgi:hypothetical protein
MFVHKQPSYGLRSTFLVATILNHVEHAGNEKDALKARSNGQFTEHVLHGPGGALTSAALPQWTLSLDAFFAR